VGRGFSSQAAEFALFRGILIYLRIFAKKVQKRLAISTIVGLMTQFYHEM